MRLAAIVAVLLLAWPAEATDLRIAVLGDPQWATYCAASDAAVAQTDAAVAWIVANASDIDVAFITGDLSMQRGRNTAAAPLEDCDCLSQTPDPGACAGFTSVYQPGGCSDCDNSEAVGCRYDDGTGAADHTTAKADCEWIRARNIVDRIEAAGVPAIVTSGNHDYNELAATGDDWTNYGRFFGMNRLPIGAKEVGGYLSPLYSTSAPSYYAVIAAGGIDWLFISTKYPDDAADQQLAMTWALSVMDDHPGLPTITLTHRQVDTDGWQSNSPYNYLDEQLNVRPQVFLNLSGHQAGFGMSEDSHIKTHATSGELIVGAVHDYSYDGHALGGLPAWVTEANGGGGVVGVIYIDAYAGSISKRSFSPTEGERVVITGGDGRNEVDWLHHVPICGQSRFTIPDGAAACDAPLRAPGCWQERR